MPRTILRITFALFLLCATYEAAAQDLKINPAPSATGPVVTGAVSAERMRFTAPNNIVQMQLQIYDEAGRSLFDVTAKGNVLDWTLQNGGGERLLPGSYLCLVTVKSLSGKLSQRIGSALVQEKQVELRRVDVTEFSPSQQQTIGPLEENSALVILKADEAQATTVLAHDGNDGHVVRGRGAFTFRLGNFFSGRDQEQMRLTEEGNLGIGTSQPQAKLDVAGDLRSSGFLRLDKGVAFADGTVQTSGLSGRKDENGNVIPNAAGTGTLNRIAKWTETGGAGTLGDSGIFEAANGFIGIGTTMPAHPFTVRRNGGTLGVHSVGELFVDRDDRTRSASLTVGTAGTLKWIFGMPYQSDGFQVYDLTNNVSRFFVDPVNGNVGIGTQAPMARLGVIGATPPTVTSFDGTNASPVLQVLGGKGGDTLSLDPTARAGDGGGVIAQAGDGGNGLDATGGYGGEVILRGGHSGFGHSAGASGGAIRLTAGDGRSFSGFGGAVTLTAGNGSEHGGGGSIFLQGGTNGPSNPNSPGFGSIAMQFFGGNVGIGINPPSQRLHVVGNSFLDGNVGIGTNATGYRVDVAGRARFRQDIGFGGPTNSAGFWLFQNTPMIDRAFIGMETDNSVGFYGNNGAGWGLIMNTQTGRVGIGTSSPDQALSLGVGTASKPGGGSWANFSDERLKNIKGRFTSGLKAVMQLQPLRYEYKRENALALKSEGQHIGFSAQAVQKIIPEAVITNDKGYLLVNNDPILWTMLNAIKEQQQTIEKLHQENQYLQANFAATGARLANIETRLKRMSRRTRRHFQPN